VGRVKKTRRLLTKQVRHRSTEADSENEPVIAAVNSSTTQKQFW
jgi:hypothetical protein